MTAILCPRCHKLVSPNSDVCIHCGLKKPGLWGLTSIIRRFGLSLDIPNTLSIVCIFLYVLGLLLDPSALLNFSSMLRIFSPSMEASFKLGMTGSQPIFRYELWWTPITAIYLHGGLLHIFFNIGWIRQLGPVIDRAFGPFRFFVIFTISGIVGFLVSAFSGSAFTLGASGSIFGLLAAAIVFGQHTGQRLFTRQLLQLSLIHI